MCGCNQLPVMSDEATKVSPATQKQQATLSIGVGMAVLLGIGAGAAIIMNRKDGHKSSSKRTRKGGSMGDAKNPFGPVGMKTVTFRSGTPTMVIGHIITSKHGGRKTTFELPLDEKTYKSIVQKILNRFPHTGIGANVKGATTAYEEFKKMAIDRGIDVNE